MIKQLDFLKKTAQIQKIPHALMFCGGNELELKTIAVEFAKFVNCLAKLGSQEPCHNCDNCKKIESGIHPDFLLLEPADSGEIEISQIRGLIWRLSLRAMSSLFKIALINRAHLMNQESQNCLLKILEEPKGKTVLILITPYPSVLLPTIVSRVQKIRFFNQKIAELENYKDIISAFLKILKSDLSFRFKFAKDLSDQNKEKIVALLEIWTFYLRTVLLKKLGDQEFNPKKIVRIISSIQNTSKLLSTTNINPRLALEVLLLEI